jgi:Family of unknown function (DUF5675)
MKIRRQFSYRFTHLWLFFSTLTTLLIISTGCSTSENPRNSLAASEDFKLTVYRQYPDKKCTSGYFAVNDTITSYSLERPWVDNLQNISSIPAGTYKGSLRYDHTDHWRIELVGVPGRTNVQIHIGNQPDQTKGCILIGKKLGSDLCSLEDSAAAYKALKKAFYGSDNPTSTPDKNISVKIVNAG